MPGGRTQSEQPAEEVDILEYRQARIQVASQSLGHVGDSGTDLPAVSRISHVSAQRLHRAHLDPAGAGNQSEQTRLSHSVRPDEADELTGGYFEADIPHGGHSFIAQTDIDEPRGRAAHGGGTRISSAGGQVELG